MESMLARGTGRQNPIWRVDYRCLSWADASDLASTARNGLYVVRGVRPQPPGTLVELTVELPDGIQVDLRGWVHSIQGDAAALKLDGRDGSGLALLEGLLREEAGRAPRPTVSTTYSMSKPKRAPVGRIIR
jgi:hypothetical protein